MVPHAPLEALTSARCYRDAGASLQQLAPDVRCADVQEDALNTHKLAKHIPLFTAHIQRLVRATHALCRLYPDTWTRAWSAEDILASDAFKSVCEHLDAIQGSDTEQLRVSVRIHAHGTTRAIVSPLRTSRAVPTVRLDPEPVRLSGPLVSYKTDARAAYDAARQRVHGTLGAAPDGCFDVLLWHDTPEGRVVTESSIANLVLERGHGDLVTPVLSEGLLPGLLIQELVRQNVVRQDVIRVDDMHRASRLWLCNAVRGMFRVELVS